MPDDDILDLSPPQPRKPVRFRIGPADDDVFTAAPAMPAQVSYEYARIAGNDDGDGLSKLQAILDLYGRLLVPESWERFQARLSDTERPIDHDDLRRVLNGLMEKYGMRPTEPSAPSSNGQASPDGGISSTATPPAEGSTSSTSPLNGSSTSSTPASSPA